MSRWFRHYAGMMRDEKLVRVSIKSKQTIERVLWVWGAILESAAEIDDNGRYDLDAAEIAYFLRADEADISRILDALADAGRVADGVVVKWGNRQFSSDRSAARVAAHRERKRSERTDGNAGVAARNADVTLQERHCNSPETETETELETEKNNKGAFAFAGSVIRLRRNDFDNWQSAYCDLDLPALLRARDDWLKSQPEAERKRWFNSTSNFLAKKQQEARTAGRRSAEPVMPVC